MCHNCHHKKFGKVTNKWIDDEYNFWIKEEGYTEEEADDVCITI